VSSTNRRSVTAAMEQLRAVDDVTLDVARIVGICVCVVL
jgi:hypothetical protein